MGHTFNNPTILRDALVLLTGANGFIASHQLLFAGYKVRRAVRDVSRCSWLDGFFRQRHGSGRFELAQVADFTAESCFDGVMMVQLRPFILLHIAIYSTAMQDLQSRKVSEAC
jgi:hypothetical protein